MMNLRKLINILSQNRVHPHKRHKKTVFQKTSDVATGVWKYLVVTLVTASWIIVYLRSKKLYLDIFQLLSYPLGKTSWGLRADDM
jgi:hypothetical protein